MDLQFKCLPFEVKASSADGSQFEGKASVFFNIDSYGEIVDDKAFDQDLPDFMANGFIGGLNHDWDNPIGRPMDGTMPMDDHLHIKASVVDTAHGLDVRKLLKAGVIKKLSIGYKTMGDMMLETEDDCMAYWEQKGYKPNAMDMARCKGGARVLTRVHLYEASPVTVPANDLAMITAVKAAREAAEKAFKSAPEVTAEVDEAPTEESSIINESPSTPREFEAFLRDAGLSRSKAREAVSLAKTLQWDAGSDEAEAAEDGPDEEVPEVAAETPAEEAEPEATVVSEEVAPEVIVTDSPSEEEKQFDPVAEHILQGRRQIARTITQRQALLDAELELSLSRLAGR